MAYSGIKQILREFYLKLKSSGTCAKAICDGNGNVITDNYANVWKGTQSEYDAITTKDPNVLYCITDGTEDLPYNVDYSSYVTVSRNSSSANSFTVTLNSARRMGNILYLTVTLTNSTTAGTSAQTNYLNISCSKATWYTTGKIVSTSSVSFYGANIFSAHWNTDNGGMLKIRTHDAWTASGAITFPLQIPLLSYTA